MRYAPVERVEELIELNQIQSPNNNVVAVQGRCATFWLLSGDGAKNWSL